MDNNTIVEPSAKSGEKIIPELCPDISNRVAFNSKTKMFVEYYLNECHCNGTKSAEKAGYKNPINASRRLLQNPTIKNYIIDRQADQARRVQLSKPQFLSKLQRLEAELTKAGRLGDRVKLLSLEADVLGLCKEDNKQQINIFGSLDKALDAIARHDQPIIEVNNAPKHGVNTFEQSSNDAPTTP